MPPYWETTVHAPAGTLDPNAYMIVDDLPSGPVFSFIMTAFVSYFFQFAGFVLTYLLHTTHAAKYGSRAGLGITLIQFGLIQYGGGGRTGMGDGDESIEHMTQQWNNTRHHSNVTGLDGDNATDPNSMYEIEMQFAITSRDWISLILMTLGMSFPSIPVLGASSSRVTYLGYLTPRHVALRLVPAALIMRGLLPRQALGGFDPRGLTAPGAGHARAARTR